MEVNEIANLRMAKLHGVLCEQDAYSIRQTLTQQLL